MSFSPLFQGPSMVLAQGSMRCHAGEGFAAYSYAYCWLALLETDTISNELAKK